MEKPVVYAAAYTAPPYAANCFVQFPKGCPKPGIEVELIADALISAGYKPQFVATPVDRSIVLESVRDLKSNITALAFAEAWDDSLVATQPVLEDQMVFMMNKYGSSSGSKKLLSTAGTSGAYALLLVTFLSIFGSAEIISHSWMRKYAKIAENTAKTSWFSAFTVIQNVFVGFLAIQLFAPINSKPLFTSMDDLALLLLNRQCSVLTIAPSGYSLRKLLNPSNESWMNEITQANLRKSYVENPPLTANGSLTKFLELIGSKEKCYIGFAWTSFVPFIKNILTDPTDYITPPGIPVRQFSYLLSKSNSKDFNEKVLAYFAGTTSLTERYNKIRDRYVQDATHEYIASLKSSGVQEELDRPLGYSDLNEIFWVQIVGSIAGGLVFAFEFLRRCSVKRNS